MAEISCCGVSLCTVPNESCVCSLGCCMLLCCRDMGLVVAVVEGGNVLNSPEGDGFLQCLRTAVYSVHQMTSLVDGASVCDWHSSDWPPSLAPPLASPLTRLASTQAGPCCN